MSDGWNFERRRDACARFLMGVSLLEPPRGQGALPDRATSLEAVRSKMRLSPEEALFAARRLHDEQLLVFDAAGPVRSTARGVERATTLMDAVRAKAQRFSDLERTLDAGGTAILVLAAVVRADGGTLPCGAPDSDPDATYRVALIEDRITLQRRGDDGVFLPVP